MDLAEQCARRVFDLGTSGSQEDETGLTRRGPLAWQVHMFSPYRLVFDVTSESSTTCRVKTSGGRPGQGYEIYRTLDLRSVDEVDKFVSDELAAWSEHRDRLSGKFY